MVVRTPIYGVLYEIDPSGGDPIYLTQTDDYILDSNDVDNWISIGFQNNYFDLIPGTQYLIAINMLTLLILLESTHQVNGSLHVIYKIMVVILVQVGLDFGIGLTIYQ